MKCRRLRRGRLNAYVDRELEQSQMDAVTRHLEQCSECRSEVQALLQLDLKMRQLISPEPSRRFKEKVMAEITGIHPEKVSFFQRWVPAFAYSLLFCTALYLGILWNNPHGTRDASLADSTAMSEFFEESETLRLSQIQDHSMASIWSEANEIQ